MVLERIFDAPCELVFKAWTSAEHLDRWFGPNGFTITTHSFEFREGGTWAFIMHGPNGINYDNWIFFTKIDEPSRLLFLHGGNADKNHPETMDVTVTFEDIGGKTRLRMRTLFPTVEQYEGAKSIGALELGQQTLGKLADYLATL
jgi:uncharacterized protein YndB with AHSA1/START domain